MKFKRSSRLSAQIDMTPVIDIVFQLLTFFMLTSTYIKTAAINVDLPESATSDMMPVREAVVTIYKNGSLMLNEENIAMENLGIRVKDLLVKNQDLVITIRGDEGVPYGKLVETMDVVRLAGVKRMSLATTQKEAP